MANVSLRGRSDGYELEIPAESNFEESLADLKKLLQKVRDQDNSVKEIAFSVQTGHRLLTTSQQAELTKLITEFDKFKLTGITADVLSEPTVENLLKTQHVSIVPQIIRSGQELSFEGDVILLGSVHQGGMLKSAKNIYVIGDVEGGILHAGFPNHREAIVAGDVSTAGQVRIGNYISVVADNSDFQAQTFAHVNDQGELVVEPLSTMRKSMPELYRKLEDK
jgi:septum site-determining protein MinC